MKSVHSINTLLSYEYSYSMLSSPTFLMCSGFWLIESKYLYEFGHFYSLIFVYTVGVWRQLIFCFEYVVRFYLNFFGNTMPLYNISLVYKLLPLPFKSLFLCLFFFTTSLIIDEYRSLLYSKLHVDWFFLLLFLVSLSETFDSAPVGYCYRVFCTYYVYVFHQTIRFLSRSLCELTDHLCGNFDAFLFHSGSAIFPLSNNSATRTNL